MLPSLGIAASITAALLGTDVPVHYAMYALPASILNPAITCWIISYLHISIHIYKYSI